MYSLIKKTNKQGDSMIIEIIDVGSPESVKTGKGQYQTLQVSFKNEQGQVQGKKLMSFSNPAVFKDIQGYAKGDRVDVLTVKEGDYWQWKAIDKEGEAPPRPAAAPTSTGGGGKVIGSNYETAEERARRQVYIIRQSSLGTAVELLGSGAAVADVINTAKQFEAYVFSKEAEGEVD
jgi:hypothetical protein